MCSRNITDAKAADLESVRPGWGEEVREVTGSMGPGPDVTGTWDSIECDGEPWKSLTEETPVRA